MFDPYKPTPTPVQIYRSTDVGAPQLKEEIGCLKTLLKTVLVNGYGGKSGLGWKMMDETSTSAIFYSPNSKNRHALKVDNTNKKSAKVHMVGGERYQIYMGYGDTPSHGHNNFGYYPKVPNNQLAWCLVGCNRAFILIITIKGSGSQILFFGDFIGAIDDDGNSLYINTSYKDYEYWESFYLNAEYQPSQYTPKYPLVGLSKQSISHNAEIEQDKAVVSDLTWAFGNFSATLQSQRYTPYPHKHYGNFFITPIIVYEFSGYLPRGTVPGLFATPHWFGEYVDELDVIGTINGHRYIRVNISDENDKHYDFALNIDEWLL